MKLISRFHDYYDHVAHMYGGGDPRVTYVREAIPPTDVPPEPGDVATVRVEMPRGESILSSRFAFQTRWHHGKDISDFTYYRLLVVAGRGWLVFDDGRTLQLVESPPPCRNFWHNHPFKGPYTQGEVHPWLVDLSKKIGKPVFMIENYYGVHPDVPRASVSIYRKCPVLADLGFTKIMSAEQAYQEIAYCVGNMLVDPTDTQPPVKLGNDQLIRKAGFDLKTSFRHRT